MNKDYEDNGVICQHEPGSKTRQNCKPEIQNSIYLKFNVMHFSHPFEFGILEFSYAFI